jgi:glycosyltransferase involved in cell wall biosynthesis
MADPQAAFGVVMVSASFYPYVGGAEKQALELSLELRKRGFSVFVATRGVAGLAAQEEIGGVVVERLFCLGSGFINAVSFLASLAFYLITRRAKYQVIHVHLAGSPAVVAGFVGKILGKKVVVKLGGGRGIGELPVSSRTFPGRLKIKALSWIHPAWVAVCQDLASEAQGYLGSGAIHVVPNGVDISRYRPVSAERKKELRAELGWPKEGLCFLYVGRLSPEKRLPDFLRVWAESGKQAAAFVSFVGEGSERAVINQAAAESKIQDRVFFNALMDRVEKAYGAADIFILPSISEGLSNALLEAMAAGLAVLASDVGGTPEAVIHRESGLLFPATDQKALKDAASELMMDPDLVSRLGRRARETAVQRFSLKKVADCYEELYRGGQG